MTLQMAFTPQEPGHGSLHTKAMQAVLNGQSEFVKHSGRHGLLYGSLESHGLHIATWFPYRSHSK